MKLHQVTKQIGFTLVEVLTVMLVLVAIASVTIEVSSDLAFQNRYEVTKDRYEKIKRAIIGRPDVLINGQPDISGFVADMGRLPASINQLIEKNTQPAYTGVCSDPTYNGDIVNCHANGGAFLNSGWRNGYLTISKDPSSENAFTDGWGRVVPGDSSNYGWRLIDNNHPTDPFEIYSFGKNHNGLYAITTPVDCSSVNGVWDSTTELCAITTGGGGSQADCESVGGNWQVDTCYSDPCDGTDYDGDCSVSITEDDYKIDVTNGISVSFKKPYTPAFGSCGFLASQATSFTTQGGCENAGGNWNGSTCTTIDAASCKSVGGKWKTCQLNSTQCASFTAGAGTTWQESCEYTENSCTASAGTWDSVNHICNFSGNSCPGASCPYTTPTACMNDKGIWVKRCIFNDATACTTSLGSGGAGATYDSTNKPNSCTFSVTQCENAGGITDGRECNLTHAEGEATVERFTKFKCQIKSKGSWFDDPNINGWSYIDTNICLKIFYRQSDSTVGTSFSDAVLVEEDGSYQTIHFSGLTTPDIPIGINAIGIYEHNGSSCTTNLYPSNRNQPIQIQFAPHTSLPIINW